MHKLVHGSEDGTTLETPHTRMLLISFICGNIVESFLAYMNPEKSLFQNRSPEYLKNLQEFSEEHLLDVLTNAVAAYAPKRHLRLLDAMSGIGIVGDYVAKN